MNRRHGLNRYDTGSFGYMTILIDLELLGRLWGLRFFRRTSKGIGKGEECRSATSVSPTFNHNSLHHPCLTNPGSYT